MEPERESERRTLGAQDLSSGTLEGMLGVVVPNDYGGIQRVDNKKMLMVEVGNENPDNMANLLDEVPPPGVFMCTTNLPPGLHHAGREYSICITDYFTNGAAFIFFGGK